MKMKKVEKTIDKIIDLISIGKFNREEIVIILSNTLIRAGFSFYFLYERGKTEKRPKSIDSEFAKNLYFDFPSTGTTMMKVGFDLQELLSNKG
jgi:hypothetical protein